MTSALRYTQTPRLDLRIALRTIGARLRVCRKAPLAAQGIFCGAPASNQ